METWKNRPQDEAALFNPAFCATLIDFAVHSYQSQSKKGVPLYLATMFLPLVLHKGTRESLPSKVTTSMPVWLNEHLDVKIAFYDRLMALKPFTREAIQFGAFVGPLRITKFGNVETVSSEKDLVRRLAKLDDEFKECAKKSRTVGKWFAVSGDPNTILLLWGINL